MNDLLHQSAVAMARAIRQREISSVELVAAHLKRIQTINPAVNAVVEVLEYCALVVAEAADKALARDGAACGPLHGVPVSIKDSIDVAGTKCTAGTVGRKNGVPARKDATVVRRLREAGAIPIAKTNLPDLLFSFESDNLIYGRTNNPYDLERTAGGSSGGEAALIAACGSPLGLGSDAAGSVRVPAAFCGIASIKPTSGRLPRTGHVPPAGGWVEALWQIGPMARFTEDLELAMSVLSGVDDEDFTSAPAPLRVSHHKNSRVAFFTYNGIAKCDAAVQDAMRRCAEFLSKSGLEVQEETPPGIAQAYELELAILGADGGEGIEAYLQDAGSSEVHPLLIGFLDHMRPFRATAAEFARRWAQWDEYRAAIMRFFQRYDVLLSPVYTQPALKHRGSLMERNFEGFSYTMAWNVAGVPAATVRCAESEGLPINVQVIANRWHDLEALQICGLIERKFGGWRTPILV